MKHNEHEVAEFQRFVKEIGADEANVIDACVRTMEQGKQFLTADKHCVFSLVLSFSFINRCRNKGMVYVSVAKTSAPDLLS